MTTSITIEDLKRAEEVKDFCADRALQLLFAKNKMECKVYSGDVGFNSASTEGVDVTFVENTSHDCPDRFYVELTVEQLIMSNAEWAEYLNGITQKRLEKERLAAEASERAKIEHKRKLFDQLKSELGE